MPAAAVDVYDAVSVPYAARIVVVICKEGSRCVADNGSDAGDWWLGIAVRSAPDSVEAVKGRAAVD